MTASKCVFFLFYKNHTLEKSKIIPEEKKKNRRWQLGHSNSNISNREQGDTLTLTPEYNLLFQDVAAMRYTAANRTELGCYLALS